MEHDMHNTGCAIGLVAEEVEEWLDAGHLGVELQVGVDVVGDGVCDAPMVAGEEGEVKGVPVLCRFDKRAAAAAAAATTTGYSE